ncbi:hypothetical protein MY1884_007601 [Beauveria asiatica]
MDLVKDTGNTTTTTRAQVRNGKQNSKRYIPRETSGAVHPFVVAINMARANVELTYLQRAPVETTQPQAEQMGSNITSEADWSLSHVRIIEPLWKINDGLIPRRSTGRDNGTVGAKNSFMFTFDEPFQVITAFVYCLPLRDGW